MKNLDVILATAGGAILGAAVGILFAPKRGTETRSDIAEYLRHKHRKCKHRIEELADQIEAELESE